jgi:putative tryptophan/tyrosine transport system substrate-binding protein
MQEIGILDSASPESRGAELSAFYRGLKESGVNGSDIIVSYVGANNDYKQLSLLADELVRRKVAVIVAAGGTISAIAAKKATATIPIVFTAVTDPVKSGLVASLQRPGGNLTGTGGITSELDPKRLDLLRQIKPKAAKIGVLANGNRPALADRLKALGVKAKKITLIVEKVVTAREIDEAFKSFAKSKVDAVLVTADPFFNDRRAQLVALAAKAKLPAIYQWPEFVAAGGLMSYGASIAEAYRQAGVNTGRILNGTKAGDIPVMQPTKFKRYVNLATAKALKIRPELFKGAVRLP